MFKKKKALKKEEFTKIEIILIFPTWFIVHMIKKCVQLGLKKKMDYDSSHQKFRKGNTGTLKKETTMLSAKKMAYIEKEKKYISTHLECIFLFPVKILFTGIMKVVKCMEKKFPKMCGVDKSHHGGLESMYDTHFNFYNETGESDVLTYEKIEITIETKKFEYLQMEVNTNCLPDLHVTPILVCQVIAIDQHGKGAKCGFKVNDIIMGVSSKVGGSLIVKPSADASPHVQKMMQHSSKPLTLTVLRANEFVYMDRDGDGHVTLDEIMDTDGDGKVSEKEKSMFDTDGDGKVTLEEVQQVS